MNETYYSRTDDGLLMFWCPGCECAHGVDNKWDIKIENEIPTISPSVLVRSGDKNGPTRCHSFVKNGTIQYLSDCTHKLKGQTVPMEKF